MKNIYKKFSTKKWFSYVMIFLAAILFTMSVQAFVLVAHTFTSGLSALAILPVMLVDGLGPYMTLIYFGLNIPLLIIFWKKIKKDFIYKTLFFLAIQGALGAPFIFDEVSDPIRSLVVKPERVYSDVWPIFLLAALGGILVGVSIAMTWKYGGSTGGGDIITYYYSTKKKISVGATSFFISMIFVVISYFVTISVDEDIRSYSLPILVSTTLYVGISSVIINTLYPKYSTIFVEIHSTKTNKINSFMKKTKYQHSWQTRDVVSGFTGKNKKIITTVMLLLEYKEFRKAITAIDKDVWIQTIKIKTLYGKFDTATID